MHFRALIDSLSTKGSQMCTYPTHPNTLGCKPFLNLTEGKSFSQVFIRLFKFKLLVESLLTKWIAVRTTKPHRFFLEDMLVL